MENNFQAQPHLGGQGYSFAVLHTSSKLLTCIEKKQGLYLAQVKQNQKLLLEECIRPTNPIFSGCQKEANLAS